MLDSRTDRSEFNCVHCKFTSIQGIITALQKKVVKSSNLNQFVTNN